MFGTRYIPVYLMYRTEFEQARAGRTVKLQTMKQNGTVTQNKESHSNEIYVGISQNFK